MHEHFRLLAVAAGVLLTAACYDSDPADPTRDVRGLSLDVLADSAPADGATTVRLVVQVPSSARGDARTASFTTTLGTLLGADAGVLKATANGADTVVAELRAPETSGWARIRSTVSGVILEDSVRFTPAWPTNIDVDPGKFALSTGFTNELNVKATLRRAVGKVTAGMMVTFTAVRADTGEPIGQHSVPAPSDATGVVTVRFSAGATDYRGPVVITATHAQSSVSGSAHVQIVD